MGLRFFLPRRLLLITAVFFVFHVPLAAAPADEGGRLLAQANEMYMQGKYADAIAVYQKILTNGFESGELYYNLGNAYYKSGDIAHAILSYERAKKFMPSDDDLRFNLQLAGLQTVDRIDAVPRLFLLRWFDAIIGFFSVSSLGIITYLFFLGTLALFSAFMFTGSLARRRTLFTTGLACSVLLFVSLVLLVSKSYREANTEYAVVLNDVVNVKAAPDNQGNDLFVIHKGLKVEVLDDVNHWRKIRLADGKVGWMPDNDCEVI